jgi:FHS family L-fucose permease-like MFS transporter
MSLMFPTIFALGIKGLGSDTKIGGSIIIMAIIGGAVLTPAMGLLSEAGHGVALAYLVPLTAYIFVCAYGFIGATWGMKADAA